MKIDIDAEMADKIVSATLLSSIENNYHYILELRAKEKLEDYEITDLGDSEDNLVFLREAYMYFTEHSEWKKLEKFDDLD